MSEMTVPGWDPLRVPANSQVPIPTRAGSYELKFLVPDAAADEILGQATMHLAPDPHADPALGDRYRVSSLYFDTADLAVFHRFGSHGRRKFRLRRYGAESKVFLERKSKSRGLVRKRRVAVPESEVANLKHGEPEQPTWPGHWFHRRLIARQLGPKCQVTYERVAHVGMTPEGPIRCTMDRHVRCRPVAGLYLSNSIDGSTILAGETIVEFKFRVAMPAVFKRLIHEFNLSPDSVSKYRMSIDACGLCSPLIPDTPARACATNSDESRAPRIHVAERRA